MTTFVTTNSSSVTISGSVNTSAALPQPNASQTIVTKYVTGASPQTLHTVTAGKTFYILGCTLSHNDATAREIGLLCDGVIQTKVILAGLTQSVAIPILAQCAATKTVTVTTTGGTIFASVWGYEV